METRGFFLNQCNFEWTAVILHAERKNENKSFSIYVLQNDYVLIQHSRKYNINFGKKKFPKILENRVLIWYKIIETSVKYDTDIT